MMNFIQNSESKVEENDANRPDSDIDDVEMRKMVQSQNRKKKKSGGFQSMGKWLSTDYIQSIDVSSR